MMLWTVRKKLKILPLTVKLSTDSPSIIRHKTLLLPCVAALATALSAPAQSQTSLPSSSTVPLQSFISGNPFSVAPGVLIDTIATGGAGITGDASQTWVLDNQGTINGATYGLDFSLADSTQITNSGTIGGVGVGTAKVVVQTGAGNDELTMAGGAINGGVDQGDGQDRFVINAGTVTGGTIGRVNMKLDDNIFDMEGGTIEGNLVTGFGNDTIRLSNGFIGGNISVSGGQDSVTVTGGEVQGEVRMSAGTDTFTWSDEGKILGLIDMGNDDDTALLRNLSNSQLAENAGLTGGTGVDALTLDNTQTGGVARFTNWVSVQLQRNSQLHMDSDLVLGDAGTQTGTLSLYATRDVLA